MFCFNCLSDLFSLSFMSGFTWSGLTGTFRLTSGPALVPVHWSLPLSKPELGNHTPLPFRFLSPPAPLWLRKQAGNCHDETLESIFTATFTKSLAHQTLRAVYFFNNTNTKYLSFLLRFEKLPGTSGSCICQAGERRRQLNQSTSPEAESLVPSITGDVNTFGPLFTGLPRNPASHPL